MLKRRRKKNLNALILQNQLKNLTLEPEITEPEIKEESKIVEPITKLKKKGVPKNELINTKRLLCS